MRGILVTLSVLASSVAGGLLPAELTGHQNLRRGSDSYNAAVAQCDGLINTHVVYNNGTDDYDCTIIDGMGPGSAWYDKNVAPYDPINFDDDENASDKYDGQDLGSASAVSKRNAPGVIYHMSRGPAQTHYGTVSMEDAIGGVAGKCGKFDCTSSNGATKKTFSNIPYIIKCDGRDQVGNKQVHGSLVVSASAIFPSKKNDPNASLKGNFVEAVKRIANKVHQFEANKKWHYCDETPMGPVGCFGGTQKSNFMGGSYFFIQRQIHTSNGYAQSGNFKVHVSMHEYTSSICKNIIKALTDLASAADPTGIAGIANDFFGKYIQNDACG